MSSEGARHIRVAELEKSALAHITEVEYLMAWPRVRVPQWQLVLLVFGHATVRRTLTLRPVGQAFVIGAYKPGRLKTTTTMYGILLVPALQIYLHLHESVPRGNNIYPSPIEPESASPYGAVEQSRRNQTGVLILPECRLT